ncbi:6-phosphogluconate dehydrogenase [Mycolicibacterium litorale]|uniref:6-phosphogluconate dehydrogenase n=1 Tax=Mycolicibacterium litorale TaxID=758802 RepID=A0A6S6PDT4_9MYCO|nr:NAD(P)-dependent oxidoreductase [Mycolicibacterium litorale]BCI54308.1 6-phosphogluconate dehydrogenase [Mycolicibacterium litorale]
MSRIGFVGAGRMGAPMVRRLVEAGHTVTALGRTQEKRTAAEELGATAVSEPSDVAAGADAVVICVFTDDQVRNMCLDNGLLASMKPGATLVIHTTGSPATAHAIADRGREYGVEVVDAPVSGGPHDIAAGAVTLFVGGSDAAVEGVRPVLAAYGDPVLHVGPLGAGQSVKLVNNTVFAAQIGLLREAVRLGGALGVAEPDLLTALTHGSSSSRVLTMVAPRGSVGAFLDMADAFVGKDVDVVRAIARDAGTDLGLLGDAIAELALTGDENC